ncbi:hypothetical protein RND71_008531 [Anisodus tanguticus]|uniref:Peptidase A1 domain-containing protein n=1 Tax=Anisodus tanguticus TaxID=243964 RepID=A0AAE1VL43_9SOLA|nr:hypothetical protein RND71_008531 [Anisodus tanguticus]
MVTKFSIFVLVFLRLFSFSFLASRELHHNFEINLNNSIATGIEFPQHPSFNVVSSSSSSANSGCSQGNSEKSTTTHSILTEKDEIFYGEIREDEENVIEAVKFHLRHRTGDSVFESTSRDLGRIQTLHTRIIEKKNQNTISRLAKNSEKESSSFELSGKLMATLESGVSHGSGEYFMDVFIGTPPKHFFLILDTGSDLNWIQCVPCYDCFEQNGPYYDPKDSSSFSNISCHDPKCHLVSSPDPPQPCKTENQTCPYYYWYGDSSNTTGDFALETFSVNLTMPSGNSEIKKVENVMFGCGHWNRGLFHGAAGLLGLGRGPLSFSSQLQSLYGHSFSYCLVNRNSDSSVSSKLIFGEDKELLQHPNLNFTSLVGGKENPAETFYYVQIKSVIVGDEVLKIPEETWNLSSQGVGGTIIDSGTTLSYFAEPAYEVIKDAFVNKVKGYPVVEDFPILRPCYNVSGVDNLELPSFGIVFGDGAIWNFPVENYFIKLEPEDIVCLAILGTPHSSMSIIGNYQQQNFHILYDTKRSRLGYAPTRCADA